MENLEHPLYKHCDIKEADGVAWAFVNKDKMIKYPFQFPEIAPDEIRINVLYAGLCQSDVHTVREVWGPCQFPLVPGHEIIGEVSLIGSEVKDFKKGEIVGFGTMRDCCGNCKFCKKGKENLCLDADFTYGLYWGGYATAMQQPAKFYFHLPEGFKIEKASPLFCAGITTFYPIEKYLNEEIQTTGVIGCGGLGHMAIQFLHKMGKHVTAFTTSEKKIDLLKKLGADKIIISTDQNQMKAARGTIEFLINTIPNDIDFQPYISCVERGGKFVQVGMPSDNDNMKINVNGLVVSEIEIIGSMVGPRHSINKMIDFCSKNDVYPIVEEYSFEEMPKAFEKLEHGKPHFRCIVNVKDYADKNGLRK
jgi:D-arabinose 1-dehydrogenase-like Zn-dependent alcohol dehydrogenase